MSLWTSYNDQLAPNYCVLETSTQLAVLLHILMRMSTILSRECNKIIGHQQKSTDAFWAYSHNRAITTDGFCVDDDPLWGGQGCGPFNSCCSFNCLPWFMKELPASTHDNIEMRLCANEPPPNEDIMNSMYYS